MGDATTTYILSSVRRAGFRMHSIERVRLHRWLIQAFHPSGALYLIMVLDRPRVGASDVQDLEDIIRIRNVDCGILWALNGSFSSYAELAQREYLLQLILTYDMPSADQCSTNEELRRQDQYIGQAKSEVSDRSRC